MSNSKSIATPYLLETTTRLPQNNYSTLFSRTDAKIYAEKTVKVIILYNVDYK